MLVKVAVTVITIITMLMIANKTEELDNYNHAISMYESEEEACTDIGVSFCPELY